MQPYTYFGTLIVFLRDVIYEWSLYIPFSNWSRVTIKDRHQHILCRNKNCKVSKNHCLWAFYAFICNFVLFSTYFFIILHCKNVLVLIRIGFKCPCDGIQCVWFIKVWCIWIAESLFLVFLKKSYFVLGFKIFFQIFSFSNF